MRGVETRIQEIRHRIFREVARMAYHTEWPVDKRIEELPYKIIPGEVGNFRNDVFLERAIVSERLRLAMGLTYRGASDPAPVSQGIEEADKPETYYTPPLINVIKFACNACPEKRVYVTDGCQGCLAHPCVEVCPKDAVSLDRTNGRSRIDPDKCIKCGQCANGVYLYTKDQKMIDSVSSWWSVIHGYKHPVINQAIISQVEKFSHVMLGGLTHEPARKLSEKLASWLPGDLDYCFFSDSGSVAVEVALKMALQYYMNRGDEKRTMILALEHAYHGDTFKTMEAGDDEDYHFVLKAYGASPYVVHIPTEITALEEAFEKYHDRLNCVLVEPLLQGAGGMRMYDVSFLKEGERAL